MENNDFVLGNLIFLEKLPVVKVLTPNNKTSCKYVSKAKYRCFCGNEFITFIKNVKNGNTKSCGCYNTYLTIKRSTKHGGRLKGKVNYLYTCLTNIKIRCLNKNAPNYEYYGGRGIAIHEEWLSSYENFRDWALKNGYKKGLTIDRIDVDGNYEPSNCRWVTKLTQSANQRPKRNQTGFPGVNPNYNKYKATISIDNKSIFLGNYDTKEEAFEVYQKAKEKRDKMYLKRLKKYGK